MTRQTHQGPGGAHDRIGCWLPGCDGVIEASVPLWLTLRCDGTWTVFGVGDDTATIVCDAQGHQNFSLPLHKSLTAFLDELLPHSTLDGVTPPPPPDEPDP